LGFFYAHAAELAAPIPGMRSPNLFRIEVIPDYQLVTYAKQYRGYAADQAQITSKKYY
jgi:hypothetical protein